MRHRAAPLVILVAVVAFAATTLETAVDPARTTDPEGLIAHEWGTFTSIAGADGNAVEWLPQGGPSDLPCFVRRVRFNTKYFLAGTVRMETPVIYFYAPRATTVNVNVRFRQGAVTEWFPEAVVTPGILEQKEFFSPGFSSTIAWTGVKVSPGVVTTLPTEDGPSHYYAARDTDAAPLQWGSQQEKFLFYRGVGRFALPIAATVTAAGRVEVTAKENEPLGDVILFENRGGSIGYQIRRAETSRATLDRPALGGNSASLRSALERILVTQGLFKKEAAAMVATWRDSWFEEGTRLFYIVPKRTIDSILPLDVKPTPIEVARVFVGRLELVTPAILNEVKESILKNDRAAIRKYGRFIEPIVQRLLAECSPADRAAVLLGLQVMHSSWTAPTVVCR